MDHDYDPLEASTMENLLQPKFIRIENLSN